MSCVPKEVNTSLKKSLCCVSSASIARSKTPPGVALNSEKTDPINYTTRHDHVSKLVS